MQTALLNRDHYGYFLARGIPRHMLGLFFDITPYEHDSELVRVTRDGHSCVALKYRVMIGEIALSVAGDGYEYHTEESLLSRLSSLPDNVQFHYRRLDTQLVHCYGGESC